MLLKVKEGGRRPREGRAGWRDQARRLASVGEGDEDLGERRERGEKSGKGKGGQGRRGVVDGERECKIKSPKRKDRAVSPEPHP